MADQMAPPLTLALRGIPAEIYHAGLRGKGLVGFHQIEIVVCFQPAFFSAEREAGTTSALT